MATTLPVGQGASLLVLTTYGAWSMVILRHSYQAQLLMEVSVHEGNHDGVVRIFVYLR